MEQRLGYAPNANPNDDQMLFDMILHIPGGLVQELNQAAWDNWGFGIDVPQAGQLTNATATDKEWLTLAMLSRSTNPASTSNMTEEELVDDLISSGEWRLINRFGMCAHINENGVIDGFVLDNIAHLIGPTPFRNLNPITFTINNGTGPFTFLPESLNIMMPWNTADPEDHNGQTSIHPDGAFHRTAGRIGEMLEPYEQALIPKRAAPFFSLLVIAVQGNNLVTLGMGGENENIRWPTARIYEWKEKQDDPGVFIYVQIEEQKQASTPFDWIDQFGSPWP